MDLKDLQLEYPELSKTLLFTIKDLLEELNQDDIKKYSIRAKNFASP
jgi:hypothetical protein